MYGLNLVEWAGSSNSNGWFNLPDINWATLTSPTVMSIAFFDLVFELNFSQVVLQPTHCHGNILDLVLTNNNELIPPLVIQSQPPLPVNTDHFIISFDILLTKSSNISKETETYNAFDFSRVVFFITCLTLCWQVVFCIQMLRILSSQSYQVCTNIIQSTELRITNPLEIRHLLSYPRSLHKGTKHIQHRIILIILNLLKVIFNWKYQMLKLIMSKPWT